MKTKIGTRLFSVREERKLNQLEMADLLGVSPSTYSRLERNETSVDIEQVVNFSKILQVPIQEFLPETMAINNTNQEGQVGFLIGNFYHYSTQNELVKDLENKLLLKDQELAFLREKIGFLEDKNDLLLKTTEWLNKQSGH
jgi:transcriptional regulator with XRE-family HTH domain